MRILLVEDDASIALGLEYSLRQEGFDPMVCRDKASAMHALEAQRFDMGIFDVSLPDGTGYEICRTVKQRTPMPVIFLTVHDEEVNVVMGLDMGADDYITKPFRVRELIARIHSVMRRVTPDASAMQIKIQNIEVYPNLAKVYRDGQEIALTAVEYRLLLKLFSHAGQVLSRNQILEDIWDIQGDFISDNALSVVVKRLREKIEADPQCPRIIQTVRGLGYKAGEVI